MPSRLYVYGLWSVCGAGLLLIVASAIQSWGRPVSAISSIAPYSDTVHVSNGIILHPPRGKYAGTDMQDGDRIVAFDGMTWEQAQRLNWHELSGRSVGEQIELLVQRGDHLRTVLLDVTAPDAWEQLVLSRYAISALICWAPSTFALWRWFRDQHRQRSLQEPYQIVADDQSSVPLWFLAWQTVALGMTMGSIKYPSTVIFADALTPVMAALVAITSLPYPRAPHTQRSGWIEVPLLSLAAISFLAIVWHGVQSPFQSDDFRRSVQLIRPQDTIALLALTSTLFGVACAAFGILTTVYPSWITTTLRGAGRVVPRYRTSLQRIANRLQALYSRCPTSITVMAQAQLMVISIYVVLDLIPRLYGGVGGGYSVLFAAIPLSYLLLYADLKAQERGWLAIQVMVAGVALIQIPNQLYRIPAGSYGKGANSADIASLLLVAFGMIGTGVWLTVDQVLRKRETPIMIAIDQLFRQPTQHDFWHCLVSEVGACVQVSTWLWIVQHAGQAWHPIALTEHARQEWLDAPSVQEKLSCLSSLEPATAVVDTQELPSTLILLPVYRYQDHSEVLIAVNPRQARFGKRLLAPYVLGRLQGAVQALRVREQQQALEAHYATAMENLRQMQRKEVRLDYESAFSRLHRGPLSDMAKLIQNLEEGAVDAATVIERIQSIHAATRGTMQQLGTYIVHTQVLSALQDRLGVWEKEYPSILFLLDAQDELSLGEAASDAVYEIVSEAVRNALKHAHPTVIRITAQQQAQHMLVSVRDDGKGFLYDEERSRWVGVAGPEGATVRAPNGLLIMKRLATALGGRLEIETSPGTGCQIRLMLPCGE